MRKNILFIVVVLLGNTFFYAQNKITYTVVGKQHEFTISQTHFYITFDQVYEQEIRKHELFKAFELIWDTSAIVTLQDKYNDFESVVNVLKNKF